MKKVLVVDDDAESYKSFLEPRFQEIEFTFLDDPKNVEPYLIDTEVLISMCRWLEPEMMYDLIQEWPFDVMINHNRFTLLNRQADKLFNLAKKKGFRYAFCWSNRKRACKIARIT